MMLVAGCWLLVAGCWLLVAGCWLLSLYTKFSFCQVPFGTNLIFYIIIDFL
jgi:hypothetical protein